MIDTSLMYSIDKNNYAPIIIERREKYESHDYIHVFCLFHALLLTKFNECSSPIHSYYMHVPSSTNK